MPNIKISELPVASAISDADVVVLNQSNTTKQGASLLLKKNLFSRTKTVGIDASTIQGCINLITDASATNQAQVLIPPGYYTENLTLKPCVSLIANGHNNGQINTVRIVGNATFTGGAVASDNTLQLIGLSFNNPSATIPAITVAATGGVTTLLHMQDCVVNFSNQATTAIGIQIGTNCSARIVNVRTQGYGVAGQGGTHVDVDGGTFYAENWVTEYGTRSVLLRGTNGALKPYAELKWCNLSVSGANVIEITSATALLTLGWTGIGNLAATGNGISIAAGSVVGSTQCVFAIQPGASNYIVTGAAGCAYYSFANSYSNAFGASYETKIGPLVAQFIYSSSDYFTGSKTFDPPSVAAGASTTTTVSCPGATTSHFADATHSTNTGANGLTLSAYVSAADTVTVRFTNQTASPVDLASGTLKVRTSL